MKRFILINKKAQAWGLDLIVASIIFVIGMSVLYVYSVNHLDQSRNILEQMFYEADVASQIILSDDKGILVDGKINQTKLDIFNSVDYNTKRNELGLSNQFYFTFEGLEIGGVPATFVGKISPASSSDLVKLTRITIYNGKPIKFEIFIWR